MKRKLSKIVSPKNSHINISLLIILPAFFILISLFITSYYNFSNNKEQIIKNCSSSLQLFSQNCENNIQNIIHAASFLDEKEDFSAALRNTSNLNDSSILYSLKNYILTFSKTYNIVDDILIINQKDDYVVSSDGIFTLDKYFDHIYSYKNYTKSYWQKYKFFDTSSYRILSPSLVNEGSDSTSVIPIIFRKTGDSKFDNLLVVNVSLDKLLAFDTSYQQTENAKIYLLNKYTGQVFGANREDFSEILNTPLHKNLLNNTAFFSYKFPDIGNSLVIPHSTTNNLSGYTYFAVVPYTDINKMQTRSILYTSSITIIFILMAFAVSMLNAKKIISPLKQVTSMLNFGKDTSSKDILIHLQQAAIAMHKKNLDLSETLPFAQEKYLINYLNSTEYSIDENTQNIIKNSLPFKHEFFASVVLQLYPTPLFYETYTAPEYNNIKSGFNSVVRQSFSEFYDVFFLSGEKETLYIILNFDERGNIEQISDILNEVCDFLKYDSEYISVYTGVGGIYKELSGLRKAHFEAISSLKIVTQTTPKIIVKPAGIKPLISDTEETLLYNTLIALDAEQASVQIQTLSSCINPMDQRSLKQLYTQILTIIFRVMRIKNISLSENRLDFEMYSDLLNKSATDIYCQILALLNVLSSYQSDNNGNTNGKDIAEYMIRHFNDSNLSLEQLSQIFNVKPNYISILIKNNLGIGFHEYLTNLRISNSKELLIQTDKSIQEIYETSGFSSKQTFFRAFKSTIGITPNEYRKQQK